MIIFFNNIKRILRRKTNMLFMIIVPVVLISFISSFASDSGMTRCGIVDYDNTVLSQRLIKSLEDKSVISFIDEKDIQNKLFGQHLDMAVIIDKGFTEDIINNSDVSIKTMSLQETNTSIPLKLSLESYINAAINIAEAANGDSIKFYEGMKSYENGVFSTMYSDITIKGNEAGITKAQMGFLVMSMLFLASFAAMIMIEDKEKKVYYRVLSGPVRVSKYMMQSMLSFFAISVIQVVLIFFFMGVILKVDFGTNVPAMILISLIFSMLCVSLGVAINTLSKDLRQSGLIMSLILSPMCMLGGAWWPLEFMPKILQGIAQFVPVTWIMKAYEKLLYGGSLASTLNEILVLLAFTVVFLLLASWRRVDIAK